MITKAQSLVLSFNAAVTHCNFAQNVSFVEHYMVPHRHIVQDSIPINTSLANPGFGDPFCEEELGSWTQTVGSHCNGNNVQHPLNTLVPRSSLLTVIPAVTQVGKLDTNCGCP